MSDWDDLFRAAKGMNDEVVSKANKRQASSSGDEASTIEPRDNKTMIYAPTSTATAVTTTTTTVRRVKKKIKRSKKLSKATLEPLDKVLNSRMDAIQRQIWESLPPWLLIGQSLCCSSEICQGWTHDTKNVDVNCQRCGWSMLHHFLKCHSNTSFNQSLTLFVLVRNIRCCCSCILEQFHVNKSGHVCIEEYARTALREAQTLLQIMGNLVCLAQFPGEAEILQQKVQNIYNSVISFHQKSSKLWRFLGSSTTCDRNKTFPLQEIFNELVQIMVDCDVAYYRIYYLQNAGIFRLESSLAFVPHPVTYFGTINLAWSVDDDCLNDFLRKSKSTSAALVNTERWGEIMAQLGLTNHDENLDGLDPMSFLHWNRMIETIYIFWKSDWMDSCDSWSHILRLIRREMVQDKKGKISQEAAFYEKHSTPAPKVLQDWRDCCRDLLCNLYAYATLSNASYREVVSSLKRLHVSNILEMGAGTGYVALQFKMMGIDVSAFDLAPTGSPQSAGCCSEVNEYHGSSPPYYHVQQSNSDRIVSLLGNTREAEKTALLLCYPPPLSSMAEDTLKSFVESGGKVVVHIGEFKGLTGSKIFERMISKQFRIEYRSHCLHWGTDAADITVWKRLTSGERPDTCTFLLPCSCCGKKESRKRFRLYRPLVYCSDDCYKDHVIERKIILSVFMVPFKIISEVNDVDDFDHGPHLEALS